MLASHVSVIDVAVCGVSLFTVPGDPMLMRYVIMPYRVTVSPTFTPLSESWGKIWTLWLVPFVPPNWLIAREKLRLRCSWIIRLELAVSATIPLL